MELQTATEGHVSVVRIRGALDTPASGEFERKVLELFNGGGRYFAFNFAGVNLLTSAGIRVLMMLAKRLGGIDKIVICSPNEQVSVVFRISGLSGHLKVTATEAEAIAALTPTNLMKPATGSEQSKLARQTFRLVSQDVEAGPAPAPAAIAAGEVSRLTARLTDLLNARPSSTGGASSPSTGNATPGR